MTFWNNFITHAQGSTGIPVNPGPGQESAGSLSLVSLTTFLANLNTLSLATNEGGGHSIKSTVIRDCKLSDSDTRYRHLIKRETVYTV